MQLEKVKVRYSKDLLRLHLRDCSFFFIGKDQQHLDFLLVPIHMKLQFCLCAKCINANTKYIVCVFFFVLRECDFRLWKKKKKRMQ